jgi:hypothetical protein
VLGLDQGKGGELRQVEAVVVDQVGLEPAVGDETGVGGGVHAEISLVPDCSVCLYQTI